MTLAQQHKAKGYRYTTHQMVSWSMGVNPVSENQYMEMAL